MAAASAVGLPVQAWVLVEDVAQRLKAEFAVPFFGRRTDEIDCVVDVDRRQQREAIRCHRSQCSVGLRRRTASGSMCDVVNAGIPTPERAITPVGRG